MYILEDLLLQSFVFEAGIVIFAGLEKFFPDLAVRIFVTLNGLGLHLGAVAGSQRWIVSETTINVLV